MLVLLLVVLDIVTTCEINHNLREYRGTSLIRNSPPPPRTTVGP